MKRVSSTLAFVLGSFAAFSSAAQIQGFVSGFAPSDVTEKREVKGVESSSDLHSDFMWGLGAEFLANPVGPLVVGGGLGFFSMQKDGSDNVVMPAIPLWGSVGVIGPDQWNVRPYLEARVGYPVPASGLETWWNKPLNFFVEGSLGAQLPYHMGVEFNCVYLTMNKNFAGEEANFRLSSLKFGGSITVHFDLSKSSAESGSKPVNQDYFASEPAPVDVPAEEPPAENVAEEPAETVTEQSETPVTDEIPAVDTLAAGAPTEESSVTEETPVVEEAPVAEDAPVEEPPVAETPAEETPVEEVAEPAPEPEKKPVAKKKATKKKATKKTAKKKTTKKKTATKKRR